MAECTVNALTASMKFFSRMFFVASKSSPLRCPIILGTVSSCIVRKNDGFTTVTSFSSLRQSQILSGQGLRIFPSLRPIRKKVFEHDDGSSIILSNSTYSM